MEDKMVGANSVKKIDERKNSLWTRLMVSILVFITYVNDDCHYLFTNLGEEYQCEIEGDYTNEFSFSTATGNTKGIEGCLEFFKKDPKELKTSLKSIIFGTVDRQGILIKKYRLNKTWPFLYFGRSKSVWC